LIFLSAKRVKPCCVEGTVRKLYGERQGSIMPAKKKSEKETPEKSSSKAGASSGKSATPAPGGANAAEESAADKLRRDGIITTFALSTKKMHRNVRDINVLNLTVTLNGEPLIDDAELSLNYGNRYGFIGRNGCGKST
jgi:ATP-binding cassette subfamily F protein 2